ncbi:MAG: FAD-binding oxidoreductase [Gammaproteobacteria bacterium]|nr:FAD-binding oxidoreductase [Gammaproteobacteria bacterium]MBQ0839690.1 FAD-binding oxidoreductase [Gammaproteobacteria bacterium]
MERLLEQLKAIVGAKGVVESPSISAVGNWRGHPYDSPLLLRPETSEQVAAILQLCNQHQQPIVIHGGLTGMVGGTSTASTEITLSLERMRKIETIDKLGRTMTVEAGVRLQEIQQAAAAENLFFALDLGARGSATIGGNIATNAGGNQVIRYGMTREQVLGLEVVLADGTVLSSMNHLLKNNAGYDLKQLFIGSEGTLGVVTKAVLRLRPAMPARNTALVGCDQFDKLPRLLGHIESALGGKLSAFEAIWDNYYQLATQGPHLGAAPLSERHPYYALIESTGNDGEAEAQVFLGALESALEQGLIVDAVLAKSEKEQQDLWAIRDNIDSLAAIAPVIIFDVGLPIEAMEDYLKHIESELRHQLGLNQLAVFGHLGDSNLHIVVGTETEDINVYHRVEELLYAPLQALGGSISAEHGIGLEKKRYLHYSRSTEEIAAMGKLKKAFDPNNILNPGKII